MATRLIKYLAVILLLFTALPALAASPVWLVEKDGNRLFLGGTFHLLGANDYPLPAGFDGAYQYSEILVFESDVGAMQQPAFIQQLMQKLSYPSGGSVRQDLSAGTYQAVEQFFASRGVPMEQMAAFKPGMLSMMMTIVELQRLGYGEAGVDVFFYNKAAKDDKNIVWLESVDEQIDFLAGLGVGQEDEMIRYTLADLENLPRTFQAMKNAWAVGDMNRLDQIAGLPLRSEFPDVYQKLIVERNNSWMSEIARMLETRTIEMVLVGALHLAGDQGLLEQLSDRGYRVRRLK